MAIKVQLVHNVSGKSYQVWAISSTRRYRIGNPFKYTKQDSQIMCWDRALKLAASFEQDIECKNE